MIEHETQQHIERGQEKWRMRYIQKPAECRYGRKQRFGLFAAIGNQELRTIGCAVQNGGISGLSGQGQARKAQKIASCARFQLLYERLQARTAAESGE